MTTKKLKKIVRGFTEADFRETVQELEECRAELETIKGQLGVNRGTQQYNELNQNVPVTSRSHSRSILAQVNLNSTEG